MNIYFTTLPIDYGPRHGEQVRLGSISKATVAKLSGRVRRWAEMSEDERAALRRLYERP